MVCIVCLNNRSEATLKIDFGDPFLETRTDLCIPHGKALQEVVKKWIFETRERVLVAESDKNRWDKTTPASTEESTEVSK